MPSIDLGTAYFFLLASNLSISLTVDDFARGALTTGGINPQPSSFRITQDTQQAQSVNICTTYVGTVEFCLDQDTDNATQVLLKPAANVTSQQWTLFGTPTSPADESATWRFQNDFTGQTRWLAVAGTTVGMLSDAPEEATQWTLIEDPSSTTPGTSVISPTESTTSSASHSSLPTQGSDIGETSGYRIPGSIIGAFVGVGVLFISLLCCGCCVLKSDRKAKVAARRALLANQPGNNLQASTSTPATDASKAIVQQHVVEEIADPPPSYRP